MSNQNQSHIIASVIITVIVYFLALWVTDGVMSKEDKAATVLIGFFAVGMVNMLVALYYNCNE